MDVVATTLKEVDRVAKKQKTCSSKTADALAKLIKAVNTARSQVQQGDASQVQAVLAELLNEVSRLGTSAQLASETKDLHGAVSKLGKVVDRHYSTDVCKAARETELDRLALNQVIAEHLYHEGQFDIGDCFVGEAGLPDGSLMKQPYSSMHTVLQQIHQRNLRPALDWVVQHRQQLGVCTAFEFSLHQLAFLQTLQDQGKLAALSYARQHLPPFQRTHMAQIQRLMGVMCFARLGSKGWSSPAPIYADLLQLDELWGGVARDFVRQSCAILGQAQDSPLLVSTAAGYAALPTLLKLATVKAVHPGVGVGAGGRASDPAHSEGGKEEEEGLNQLPVEIPLGPEFVFHSIFACPVSREQSSSSNPPWMLPCGHVMCRQSVLKIAKTASRPFKCPYCPQEATAGQCKELIFPDME